MGQALLVVSLPPSIFLEILTYEIFIHQRTLILTTQIIDLDLFNNFVTPPLTNIEILTYHTDNFLRIAT